MAYNLCHIGTIPFVINGVSLSGGKVYTYIANSSTPKFTYTDNTGGTQHANPVLLDSNGLKNGGIWLKNDSRYKFIIKSSDDATTYITLDNVEGISFDIGNGTYTISTIKDSNGTNIETFTTTANAVNYLDLANAATGNGPTMSSAGSDTNIDVNITAKGSGTIKLNDNTSVTGTLAVSSTSALTGNVTMSGSAAVTGNTTLTGALAFGRIAPSITASQDDWNPTGLSTCSFITVSANSSYNITGITAPSPTDSKIIMIRYNSSGTLTLKHQSSSSIAANRFYFGDTKDRILNTGDSCVIAYTGSLWCLLGISSSLHINSSATQAEQEAASSTSVPVTPGVQKYSPTASKAWVRFTSVTSTTIAASYNVTSLTDNGTGDTTINFTTAFSGSDYCICTGVGNLTAAASNRAVYVSTNTAPTTSATKVIAYDSGFGVTDLNQQYVSFFGDQ